MNEKINARIQALEAELAGLKKELAEPKKEGRFRAERNTYYKRIVLNPSGKFVIQEVMDTRDSIDNSYYDNFNHFRPDTDEADRMAEKIKLLLAMKARVKELNGDCAADLGNGILKWGVRLYNNKCCIDWFYGYNSFIFGLSVQSKEHAEILLNEFKERIERWY